MYYVYILKSLKDNGVYIGCTGLTPYVRLEKYHNAGRVRSTKPRRPFILLYFEEYNDKHDAFMREYFLKTPDGYSEKLRIISNVK